MTHRVAAVDVLLAAALLCRDYTVSCPRLLTERQLRHRPSKVVLPAAHGIRLVAVIPDGWFQLRVATGDPYSIAVELDRGTEDQSAWRRKVAGYAAWAQGPYRTAFDTDNLTIAVVTPTRERRDQLRSWTATSLREDALYLSDLVAAPGVYVLRIPESVHMSKTCFNEACSQLCYSGTSRSWGTQSP